MDELVGYARRTMTEKGYTFDEAFQSVVSHIDKTIHGRTT